MAKVHKAHKHTKKYRFQRKKVNVKALLIALAVAVVAAIGLKIAYDNYVYGTFDVAAPTNEQLNNIAANWELLNADAEHFYNYYDYYYALLGYENDGTDGSNGVHLYYTGSEKADEVYIYVYIGEQSTDETVVAAGAFGRTTLTGFINGEAPWGQTDVQLEASNNNCYISVYDADAEVIDDELLSEIIAEIEAIIAAGTAEAEEAAEETAEEATEEVTEEAAEEVTEEAAEEETEEVTEEATEEVTEEAAEEAAEEETEEVTEEATEEVTEEAAEEETEEAAE